MHTMPFSQRDQIPILRSLEPLKPLMNEYIMYQEIGDPIEQNAQTDEEKVVESRIHAVIEKRNAGNREDEEKCIVLLEYMRITGLMMVFV